MDDKSRHDNIDEKPDAFWRKVYFAVIVNTILVVTALWAFSRYFGS
ncbi:MAG: hypothetical protein ACR2M8_11990 [Pyrinomonadaceae bacterium]|nr:hypothetical protein [Blastocatellia bacterium]MDQ3490666.1 hypothetical protein [Acidobacteriota bacterium]